MTNENLQAVHNYMVTIVQQWASELITDKELTDELAKLSQMFARKAEALPGLIDPNSGLQY